MIKNTIVNLDFEAICQRCGICCGSEDGDPCQHLKKDKDNKYYCDIYQKRFGLHKTVNGTIINCVPIEEALRGREELRKKCAYAKSAANEKNKT
ncbi:MAG: hypothetical protein KAJ66_03770 [Candidatus Omnitrophica bacterium]|nr:hypothetical protein [Candidatus Omnitrophota bacterium]